MHSLHDYQYELPEKLIAQEPAKERDQSKLLVLNRETGRVAHHRFHDLFDLLSPADVLVINDTEVIPGRLVGRKETGGRIEILILDYAIGDKKRPAKNIYIFDCLVKASKQPKPGTRLYFDEELKGEIVSFQGGIHRIEFSCNGDFNDCLYRLGQIPLPPYIKRGLNRKSCDDRLAYQTVYASQKGAVAAPTAGLHFSKMLLKRLLSKGVKIVPITLHVGYGTFLPVRETDIRHHRMHSEWYHITKKSAGALNRAKKNNCRIVAVGTTSVRTLEFAINLNGEIAPGSGRCDLFIYPGFKFKAVDAMITNFHLPGSTLLMLVAAFAGLEKLLDIYQEAVKKVYRFYSYGDAMFIT